MSKKITLATIALSTLILAGCANKAPSIVSGDFGINLGQHAGTLNVTGYEQETNELLVIAPQPNQDFTSYNVGVDPKNGTVERITAIGSTENTEECLIKKSTWFNNLKSQYKDSYRSAGKLDANSQFVGFDNATVTVSCFDDFIVEYKTR